MDTFRWMLFAYYIFIGTLQVLLMKASGEGAKGTGKSVAYNTSSAIMFIELLKILVCLGMEKYQHEELRNKGESRTTTTWTGFAIYGVPGLLYALENNAKIPATVYLHPHVFALFNNSKVIFSAVGMVIILGKKFSFLQWASMALLGMSLCIAKLGLLLPAPACESKDVANASATSSNSALFVLGLTLCLVASCLSGMAGVSNELLLKKRDEDVSLWRKNIWMYCWGVIFNLIGMVIQSISSDGGSEMFASVFRGYDLAVWSMIVVTALLGISVSLIMKYFDNVVKCFGGSLILYTTTLASMVLFGSTAHADFWLGLMVYSVSSYFYAGDHNKKLDTYTMYEDEIEGMIASKKKAQTEMTALTAVAVGKA